VIEAASAAALRKGYVTIAARDIEEGNYAIVADELLGRLVELQKEHPSRSVCLVSGGELSCPVTGSGFGGRNQEFVLYCASRIASFNTESTVVVLSCGTDGIDGNSCAAGAIASSATLLEAERNGLNYSVYLKANDSHSFFKKAGGLIATGPTGNNVRDIRIMLSEPGKARVA
jgi:glycerate-2-kinase